MTKDLRKSISLIPKLVFVDQKPGTNKLGYILKFVSQAIQQSYFSSRRGNTKFSIGEISGGGGRAAGR